MDRGSMSKRLLGWCCLLGLDKDKTEEVSGYMLVFDQAKTEKVSQLVLGSKIIPYRFWEVRQINLARHMEHNILDWESWWYEDFIWIDFH